MNSFANLLARALTIMHERAREANTAVRQGSLFRDILYYFKTLIDDILKSIDILAVTKADNARVDALINGIRKQEGVNTYSTGSNSLSAVYGLTAGNNGSNTIPKENGWDVLVRNDETKGGISNRYNWNGTSWIDMETGLYDENVATQEDINASKQLAEYHFPLLCANSELLSKDIILSKDEGILSVDIKKDLFFYYKTQTGTANYLMPEKQIVEIPLKSNTSIIALGIIFNPKTSRQSNGCRYSYVLLPDESQLIPILADGEVFAPILTISNVTTDKPIITNGTVYDNIKSSELLAIQNNIIGVNSKIDYNYNVEVVTSIDENNFILTKVNASTATVKINKSIVYATKLLHQRNFVYPPITTLTIPLVTGSSVATIGIVFEPLNGNVTPIGRYDYMLSPSNGDNSPILAKGEVFAPLFTISGLSTSTLIMSSGKVLDKIMSAKIISIENQLSNITPKKSNPLLYGSNLGLDVLNEWSNEFVKVADGVKLKPNLFYWVKRNYRVNKRTFNIDFNTSDCSRFYIHTHDFGDGGTVGETAFLDVDIAQKRVVIADAYKTNTRRLTYDFQANKDYRIEVKQHDRRIVIKVIDLLTGISSNEQISINEGIKGDHPNTGLLYDVLSIMTEDANSIILKKYSIISNVKNPYIIFFGDSIDVGFYSTVVDGKSINGYTQLIGEAIDMPYLVSGRGGGTLKGLLGDDTFVGRLHTELSALRPTYAMVKIGTNRGHTYEEYKEAVEVILSYGVIPILNNIPLRSDNAPFVKTSNDAINRVRQEYGLRGIRFDLATSVNNDGVTFDASLFVDEAPNASVHPNDAGHLAMANRAYIDVPELFLM